MKKLLSIYPRLFLLFFLIPGFVVKADSLLFIEDLKSFIYAEAGYELKESFYTEWSNEEKPYVYLYVSLSDSVKRPQEFKSSFIYYQTDEDSAKMKEQSYQRKGYHTFIYKTYANSAAQLNSNLIAYSKDAIAFIVFHEYIHNYLSERKIKIFYEFEEALCDVVGNYGALMYAQTRQKASLDSIQQQIESNEKIYKYMNQTVSMNNRNHVQVIEENEKCTKKVREILGNANLFQKDRFNYNVNNAFLLKNEYYSKNYFLLKDVFLKQKTLKAFLEVVEKMPDNSADCERYLQRNK
ncbi:MAG: hypothetical protein KA444_05930 [Bacteroidia bacterium]|nr:hypothetical protein [Bacteroidia bacterium]